MALMDLKGCDALATALLLDAQQEFRTLGRGALDSASNLVSHIIYTTDTNGVSLREITVARKAPTGGQWHCRSVLHWLCTSKR